MTTERKSGTIIRLVRDRAFGFIHCPADNADHFFHQAQLANCTYGQLTEGSPVTFSLGVGPKNRTEAQDVRLEDRADMTPTGQGAHERTTSRRR